MNLLVVEDDPAIGRSLEQGFQEAGRECVWVRNGTKGLELAQSRQFDAIVLDVLLPGISGLEVLSNLRTEGIRTPVVLLTALGSVNERVGGLQAGADDYVVKPFAFAELVARIDAVCRRTGDRPPTTREVGSLRLDLSTRRVTIDETEVDLTPTEFSILEFLMRHSGQVVTRRMLCEHLWDSDWEGTTNVIEVHINRLRRKLDRASDGHEESWIETIRGRGYAIRSFA